MNTIGNAQQMGALGIQRGVQQVERCAASTASAESFSGARYDLVDSLVGLEEGKHQAQASAKVVQAADNMIGSLLDVKA